MAQAQSRCAGEAKISRKHIEPRIRAGLKGLVVTDVWTQLFAGIAHELSNTLLPVRAHQSILAATASTDDQRSRAASLAGTVNRLQRLLDSLQVLSADPSLTGSSTVELGDWWPRVEGLFRKALPRGVELTGGVPADSDFATRTVRAEQADLTRIVLERIFHAGQSLAGNVPAGTHVRGSVNVHVAAAGQSVNIAVLATTADRQLTAEPALVLPLADAHALCPPRSPASAESRVAVVSVVDDRASAIVRFMLSSTLGPGASVRSAPEPGEADVWVVQFVPGVLPLAKAWRRARPQGRLVLVGSPTADEQAAWRDVGAVPVKSPDDLDEMRSTIGRVVSESGGRKL